MTSHKPQCQKDMKTSNIMMVFNLIKQQKELSRADIAKTVKMSATSITRIINLLSELKIVYESHFNSQHLGRKSMLLRLTDQQYYFCTGAIDSDQILLSIFTLTGTELIHVAAPTSAALHVEEVCDIFLDLYEKALKELQLETSKIVYVGISLIGLVDDTRGLSLFVPQFNWSTTHIADIISQKICKPVCINNDVKAMLLGILYETPSYLEKNIVLLHIGTGVGAACYYNHELFRGSRNFAGEIGHTLVDPGGSKCDCGRRGCLQTMIVEKFLVQKVHDAGIPVDSLDEILALSGRNPTLDKIKQNIITYISMAICNLESIFNPDQIIITGSYVDSYRELIDSAIQKANHDLFFPGEERTVITIKESWYKYHLLGMFQSAQKEFIMDLVESNVATPY
ncbi:ROK family protein [Enterocloster lavalensis]|uniref:ROK family protein n=1 Tax=Enterocloster lavalensis TaxID=460384 RepID=UPI001D08758D|nr:ROK family protein [Enterocloster lavalensis]